MNKIKLYLSTVLIMVGSSALANPYNWPVTRVIDGDTVNIFLSSTIIAWTNLAALNDIAEADIAIGRDLDAAFSQALGQAIKFTPLAPQFLSKLFNLSLLVQTDHED